MPIHLVFADSDLPFVEKLSAWMHKNMPRKFVIEVLTSKESMQLWLESGQKADAFLVSPSLYQENLQDLTVNVVLLDDGSHPALPDGIPRLMKYQQAPVLVKEILSLCAERMPKVHTKPSYGHMVTLVIHADGDSVSPAGPAIATLLAESGRHTLYFSLEQNQATDLYFHGSNTKGLNEMIYYVKSNKVNLSLLLEACCAKDPCGVDYLKAPPGLFNAMQLTKAEIDRLLQAVLERNIYDEVVIAADLILSEALLHLAKVSDRIVITMVSGPSSGIKLRRILNELDTRQDDAAELTKKVRLCLVKINDYISDIPAEPNAFSPMRH
jgi:phosphoribosyl-ATP pyrophosphohydrolase